VKRKAGYGVLQCVQLKEEVRAASSEQRAATSLESGHGREMQVDPVNAAADGAEGATSPRFKARRVLCQPGAAPCDFCRNPCNQPGNPHQDELRRVVGVAVAVKVRHVAVGCLHPERVRQLRPALLGHTVPVARQGGRLRTGTRDGRGGRVRVGALR
jgi:hypothetical protein